MTLSGIYIYPIKSMGGIALNSAVLEERGLQFDRRWMLIDDDNRFLSQREFSQMALFNLSLASDNLQVQYQNDAISIPLGEDFYSIAEKVTVWDDNFPALVASLEINQWFSKQLNTSCRLVYQGLTSVRMTSSKYVASREVSMADGYPYLMISEESLNALNEKLDTPIPMNRFRPNLVIKGEAPHIEDQYPLFNIGQAEFRAAKPCARCQIITIDQSNGHANKEPLKVLSSYRKDGNKVLFGQNLVLESLPGGEIRVGDVVSYLK